MSKDSVNLADAMEEAVIDLLIFLADLGIVEEDTFIDFDEDVYVEKRILYG